MGTSKHGPAGSLEPISKKGKWHDEIDGAGLGELTALATDIIKTIDTTVKQVAKGKIRVGKLLLEARGLFPNDHDFGTWRKECTPVQSKQHAHYLMQVAERFGNATILIEGANYSVMQELILAEQKDIQWVVDKIDDGEPPTVQEVRTKVKQTQAERLSPKGTSKKGMVISPDIGTVNSPNASMNQIVEMTLTLRIKTVIDRKIKGIEGDYIILGMDPDPQTPCHPEVLDAIYAYWIENCEGNDQTFVLDRSYERVAEEFRSWT